MRRYWRLARRFGAISLLLCVWIAFAAAQAAVPVPMKAVAAENFYGDIIQQIGGNRVSVTSILSDPNVDPHEYESNVADAKAIADARLVVENGGGYDDWMDKLLSASANGDRTVLKGFDLAVYKLPDNEHVWYNVDNVSAIGRAITSALDAADPAGRRTYEANLRLFQNSLVKIKAKIAQIKTRHAGTPVGLTETIFLYQSEPLGFKMLTPFEFQKAIAEGNDPPAETVIEAEQQITDKRIKVLIYNEQTVTPLTTKLEDEAKAQGIPIVPVTETMPSVLNYQNWMLAQLNALDAALGK